MNFRGSTGYGRKFWEAALPAMGTKYAGDITDGVKWLIDQGIADQKGSQFTAGVTAAMPS